MTFLKLGIITMAIAAQRFQFSDNQNIVPTTNFYSIDDAGVLNGAIAGTTAAKQALNGSLFGLISGNSKSSAQAILGSALGIDNVSMATRLGIGNILPGLDLPKFDIVGAINNAGLSLDNLLNFAFGTNSTFKNIFKTLSGDCLNNIFGNMNCPTNSGNFNNNGLSKYGNMGSCNMSQFLSLLNQYTGNPSDYGYSNICAQSSILRGVTTNASSIGVPNFFSTSIAANNELQTPSVINSGNYLLNDFLDKDDPYGFMDVANSTVTAGSKIPAGEFLNSSPNIISKAANSITMPSFLSSGSKASFFNNYTDSLSNIDSSWYNKGNYASISSLVGDNDPSTIDLSNFKEMSLSSLDLGNHISSQNFVDAATNPTNLYKAQQGLSFDFHNALNSSMFSFA